MNYGEHKFIKLKLINNSSTDDTITLSTVLGYERGGDLIVPEGTTMVTEKIKEKNYIMVSSASPDTNYLRSNLKKEEISSIAFTNDNIVPDNMTSVDVSKDGDGTVIMWYGSANSDGLYDAYIGSENGITSIYNGAYMFSYLTKMKSIDLRYTDTSNVTDMGYMFYQCNILERLDLSNFNTSNVTDMVQMFNGCQKLKNLDVSSFDTSKVTNLNYTFYGCSSLTSLDVSNFNTSNVTNLSRTFSDCTGLTKLDLSNFNTSKVTDIHSMFNGSINLKIIDLRNADFSNITNYDYMFYRIPATSSIYVKDSAQKTWIESKFTNLTNVIVA